jgi:hypothetical protein
VKLLQRWTKFWFEPWSPVPLGAVRALWFLLLLVVFRLFWWNPLDFAEVGDALWLPRPIFALLGLPKVGAGTMAVLRAVFLLSLGLASVGALTRVATAVAAVVGFYYIGFIYNFGSLSHGETVVIFANLAFALSRSGDALSVDQAIRNWRAGKPLLTPREGHEGEYAWTIKLMWLVITFIYFNAGVAKLRHSGLEWIFSDTLAIWLVDVNNYHFLSGYPRSDLGLWIAKQTWIVRSLSFLTVLLELAFPLALISGRARAVLVPSFITFNVSVFFTMGPIFWILICTNLFLWLPWERIWQRLRPA